MKKLFLIPVLGLFAFGANAQNHTTHEWRSLQNKGENLKTIQQAMETKYAGKSANKKSPNYSRSYKQYKRWEHYWKNRVNGKGNFVSAQQTYEEAIQMKQNAAFRSPSAANWSIIGPVTLPQSTIVTYGGMGRINAIAWPAGNTNTLYVGSPSGGLWKSTNGGTSWAPLTDNLITLGVSDIVVSHNDANTIYLATGDADGQQNSSVGILKSTDGGNTWNQTGLTFQKSATKQTSRIVQSSANANTLLVASTDGIHKTTDGGANWTMVHNTAVHDLEYDPNNAMVLYASGSNAVVKSTDGGNTWNSITPNGMTGRIELGLTKANSNFIIAVDDAGAVRGSTDGGSNWSSLTTISNFSSQGGYNLAVAVAPTNQNLIMVGGVNGWRSTDGGTTWENYLNGYWNQGDPHFYVHSDHHVFKFLPNSTTMLTGNDGGVHRGDASAAASWTDLSSGLAITQFYGLAVAPNDAGIIVAGSQDNDASQLSNGTWNNRIGPSDGIEGMIDPTNPTMIQYASSQEGRLTRTDDGWNNEMDISPQANGCGFVWPMTLDPATPTTVYAGCDELYKSTNKGDNWTAITNGQLNGSFLTEMCIAPSNSNTIYITDGYTLLSTTNGGTSWNTLTGPMASGNITGIAVHPTNPQTLWLTYSGYNANEKVYTSTDGGSNWTNYSGNLPNIPVNCILAQTGVNNEAIYIGTDLGVFYRDNSLSNWQAYNTGLPNVIVNDLEITYSANKLRAATFGRGVWESNLNSVVSNVKKTASSNDAFEFTTFPNPTNGTLNININDYNKNNTYSLTIYNLLGGVVYHQENVTTGVRQVHLDDVANGIYMVSIATQNAVKTAKIELAR